MSLHDDLLLQPTVSQDLVRMGPEVVAQRQVIDPVFPATLHKVKVCRLAQAPAKVSSARYASFAEVIPTRGSQACGDALDHAWRLDADHEVNDRLCRHAGYSRTADVLDASPEITERDTDLIGKRQRPLRPRRIVAHQADWLIKSPIFVQTELPLHPPGEAPIMTFPRPILCHIGRFQTLDFQRVSL